MADTKISDIIVPEIFLPYVTEQTSEKSELINSGIVQADAQFDRLASQGGRIIQMPFWQDLTGNDEVIGDSSTLTVNPITTDQDSARKHQRGKAWGANDLAGLLAGDDPMAAIANLVAEYRVRRLQAQLISTLQGIFKAGSMSGNQSAIHKVSGTPDSSNYLTGSTFIDASQLMGDQKSRLTAVMMHSAVESHLRKLDLIDYVKPSEAANSIPYFQGHRVICDDGVGTETVDTKTVYHTYLFGQGAIALGFSDFNDPIEGGFGTWQLEMGRVGLAGTSWMANRWQNILHPRGVEWQEASVAGESPTNTEIATASNWTRVYEAQNVRIIQIKHNIAA